MEVVRVREYVDDKIVFASMNDMKSFFDLVTNGQGVIFEYVECPKGNKHGEYVNPSILTPISDGKISITSMELSNV
jgi:hypothetical protein